MKQNNYVGKIGMFVNPLYPSLHRKACEIEHDYGSENAEYSFRFSINFLNGAEPMAARECEVVFWFAFFPRKPYNIK